jgi:hypothetical protein
MRRLLRVAIAGVVLIALNALGAFAQDQDKEVKGQDDKKEVKLPRREYSHVTQTKKECKFVLDGDKGTADYYFNGKHQQEGLSFARYAVVQGPFGKRPGWIYQAENPEKKDKKMWFFFSKDPVKRPEGASDYPMLYSTQPPDQTGKQPWTPIMLTTKAVDKEKDVPKDLPDK